MKSLAIALLAVPLFAVGCAKAKPPVSKVAFAGGAVLTTPSFVEAGGEPLTFIHAYWNGTAATNEPVLTVQFFGRDPRDARSIELSLDSFEETCANHKLSLHVRATRKGRKLKAFCGKEY
jgi:hypothetical protein